MVADPKVASPLNAGERMEPLVAGATTKCMVPPELTLLVAAGEQEDLCPFFASRRHGALA